MTDRDVTKPESMGRNSATEDFDREMLSEFNGNASCLALRWGLMVQNNYTMGTLWDMRYVHPQMSCTTRPSASLYIDIFGCTYRHVPHVPIV